MHTNKKAFNTADMVPQTPLAIQAHANRAQLTDEERVKVYHLLQGWSIDWVLKDGAMSHVARLMGVHRSTIKRIWDHAKKAHADGLDVSPAVHSQKHARGRNPLYDRAELNAHMLAIPLRSRKTSRSLAAQLGVSKGMVHHLTKGDQPLVRAHTSSIKPSLTDDNKVQRCIFAMEHKGADGKFVDMFDRVHVDEKWFYMTEENCRFYLAQGEEDPPRTTRHKGHIDKIMFLCAVARPRYCQHTKAMWDGKIGIWPVAEKRAALRNSIHRPAGTEEWKSVNMDKARYTFMMTNLVLPAIDEKWPPGQRNTKIWIQQDNATPHIDSTDVAFQEKLAELQLNATLYYQPPNSPDTNVLDLCFFNAIQSLQHTAAPTNKDELVEAVDSAFSRLSATKLNYSFLTLQGCMNEILECHGDNSYKIPHMGKERLERLGTLPTSLEVTQESEDWERVTNQQE
jgi:hypothetical protein